ncbi:MAG: hypothetical protein U0837_12010 [Dehalococcoidia bacterium]
MKYKVYWVQAAVDDLAEVFAARARDGQRIVLTARTFGRDGRGDVKKLQGSKTGEWRLRAGDWRVLFTIVDDEVWISQVDNRRDAY